MGLTLDQIRQQFNLPKSTSDAEVMRIALEQNITIDFSGAGSNSTSFVNSNSDVSVWGSLPQSETSQSDDIYGGMGLSFEKTSNVAQKAVDNKAVSDANATTEAKDTEKSALETRTEAILAQIFGDKEVKIKSKEIKNSTERIETEDGTIIEIPLQEGDEGYDPANKNALRTDVQYKIYKNGNVVTKNQDGTESTRKAVNGEEGYVKDGESFDERLKRFYAAEYKNGEPSLERKKELAKKYVSQYLTGKNNDVQIGDFKKLLRNTEPDSEMGRALVTLASELNDDVISDAIEEVYGTRQTDEAIAAVTDELTNGGIIAGIKNKDVQMHVIQTTSKHVVTEENAQSYADMSHHVHKDNQTQAVQLGYHNISSEEAKGVFHASVTNAIAEYDTDNVMDIANIALENDDEEHTGAKNMADHGQDLDASIQAEFAQLLTDLGIEDVSEILASHAYEYDMTCRDDVIKMLKEQGFEKTQAALEKSRQEYEEKAEMAKKEAEAKKAQREAEAKAAEEAKAKKEAEDARKVAEAESAKKSGSIKDLDRGSGAAKAVKSEIFKNSDIKEKEDFINSLSAKNRQEAIKSIVENAQGFELDGLMFSGLKNEILSYLVSHPTPKNNNTLRYLQRYMSTEDRKNVSEMKKEREKKGVVSEKIQNVQSQASIEKPSDDKGAAEKKEQKNPFMFNFKYNK